MLTWILTLPLVLATACGGDSVETGEESSPPTLVELKNTTYRGFEGDARSATLTDGDRFRNTGRHIWDGG